MQLTGNYGLKKPDQNDAYNIQNENDNMDILDREMQAISNLNSLIYPTTNIGNNYSVSVPNLTTLTDGYPITVKFNIASTGAITINPTNLGNKVVVDYFNKPVTNVRKDLIANLRYDATNGNFQLLGKGGGGNVTNSQVLINKTYTSDNGPGIGIMPDNGGTIITPSTYNKPIAQGYQNGQGYVVGEPNLTQDKIVYPYSMFGIQGTATIESLGGLRYKRIEYSPSDIIIQDSGNGIEGTALQKTLPISFTPKFMIVNIQSIQVCINFVENSIFANMYDDHTETKVVLDSSHNTYIYSASTASRFVEYREHEKYLNVWARSITTPRTPSHVDIIY